MNPDTLERLLIDRAGGQLSGDVAELLDAALREHPDWARAAAEIDDTHRLAALALAASAPRALPAPRFRAPEKPAPGWRVPAWAIGMAACFVAGAALTWKVAPARPASPSVAVRESVALSGSPRPVVIWKSPVRLPELKTIL